MANKAKHIHKFRKHKYPNGNAIFFCSLPDCHFKVETSLAIGKEVLCNQCGEPFILNEYSIRLAKPHCSDCGKKEVRDSNGNKFYISKREARVLTATAADDVNNLRNRLDNLVKDEEI